jgi:hypothetical protein
MRPFVRAVVFVVILDKRLIDRLFIELPFPIFSKSRNKSGFNSKSHWDGTVIRDYL